MGREGGEGGRGVGVRGRGLMRGKVPPLKRNFAKKERIPKTRFAKGGEFYLFGGKPLDREKIKIAGQVKVRA